TKRCEDSMISRSPARLTLYYAHPGKSFLGPTVLRGDHVHVVHSRLPHYVGRDYTERAHSVQAKKHSSAHPQERKEPRAALRAQSPGGRATRSHEPLGSFVDEVRPIGWAGPGRPRHVHRRMIVVGVDPEAGRGASEGPEPHRRQLEDPEAERTVQH